MWRERLLPLLERHLAERCDSVTAYQLAYHEAALANLLEVSGRVGGWEGGRVGGGGGLVAHHNVLLLGLGPPSGRNCALDAPP